MAIQDIFHRLKADIDRINHSLAANLSSHVKLINDVGNYILTSGGKRVRPLLFVLSARLCGCRDDQLADVSTIFEYLHAATLLHDDVVDAATVRRGISSANMIWGNQAVILVGDFLLAKALSIASATERMKVVEVLSRTTTMMAEGEVLQLIHTGNVNLTEADYFEVITRKTAILMSAACRIGAIMAGVDEARETALSEFGLNLGITFQLVDDLLDYTGDAQALGKPVGNDLKEGKITLPLIHALAAATGAERQRLQEVAAAPDPEAMARDLIPAMERYGSLDHARRQAQEYNRKAQTCLEAFAASPEKDLFLEITNYLVARTF